MRPAMIPEFPPEEVDLFWRIWISVIRMRNSADRLDLGLDNEGKKVELSCHILARAAENIFFPDVKCVDGCFAGGYKHSWLMTASDHIIDVYPVGTIGGPQMKDAQRRSPWVHLYREMSARECEGYFNGLFKEAWFKRAVAIATKALRTCTKSGKCDDIEVAIIAEVERESAEPEKIFMGMSSH